MLRISPSQEELNSLVDQLPEPFIMLGDFNGHSILCANVLGETFSKVRIGSTFSDPFVQLEGVPQGSVLSVTLFTIHFFRILLNLPLSVPGTLYVDDLQISCQGSNMRLTERQLQTAMNNLVKWCDQNGYKISQNYGCIAYGYASNSALKKHDTVHHSALRICSGAFRTSPVQSLYVACHQLPLSLRRQKLSLQYYFKILSTTNHPLQHNTVSRFLNRLYNVRPTDIRPFMERIKPILSDTHLADTRVLASEPFCFPPWNVTSIAHINPFNGFSKAHADPFIFQQLYLAHRSQYDNYKAILTDGSKMTDHVGFGVLIDEDTYSHTLPIYCSIFTAEVTAILYALKRISSYEYRNFCLYTVNTSFFATTAKF
ncbi:hypothetical protein AVEN_196605-1 [Araneus ventricosus]|uniref:Reverse transcriptase domain-containing protein n=1 Tax=Araneus ventricosus TaxID=182803 RepID=A0A4Y2GSI6_ARAVE|nr:hypothetical protein AVEN_196605-1 [Araneus ventricosus]